MQFSKEFDYALFNHVRIINRNNQPDLSVSGTRKLSRNHQTSHVEATDFEEVISEAGKMLRNTKYTYTYKYEARNPAEFTLEYYNITPPTDDVYEDQGFNWPLWGGLGVGCIVLSLVLAWIARRRNRLKAGG